MQLHYITLHHITSHQITLHYITLHYSKVAWLELKTEARSTLKQKGGGFVTEYSPLPANPPVISSAGHNFNEYTFEGTNQSDEAQGKYFDIISPNAAEYKSMVRSAIEERYNYITYMHFTFELLSLLSYNMHQYYHHHHQ